MENIGGVQVRKNPKRKPFLDICNTVSSASLLPTNSRSKSESRPPGIENRIVESSIPEGSSCSNRTPSDPSVHYRRKSKLNPIHIADGSVSEMNSSDKNVSITPESCSGSNVASCSSPAPNKHQSVFQQIRTTYRRRKSGTSEFETGLQNLETGTREHETVAQGLGTGTIEVETVRQGIDTTGTSEIEIHNKRRRTGTSGPKADTTKKRKTGTNEIEIDIDRRKCAGTSEIARETHLTGVSSYPQLQKTMQKEVKKPTKRTKRPALTTVPQKKRQKKVELIEDYLAKQKAYFEEIDKEELLEEDVNSE